MRTYQHLKNWSKVLRLVCAPEKRNAIHSVLVARLKQMACEVPLVERRHDVDALSGFWRELITEERRSPRIASQAALYFVQLGRTDDAKRIVEEGLKTHWGGRLIRRYVDCAVPDKALPLIQ